VPLTESQIADVVRTARTVAVVGMKDESRPNEPAHSVPRRMHEVGIRIVPVNPTIASALGVTALRDLGALEERVDVLQVFRRPEHVPAVADEVLRMRPELRPELVWLQSGIVNDEAAARLEAAGIRVVQDRCFAVDLARFGRAVAG